MQIEVNRDGLVSIGCVNNHLCIQLTIIYYYIILHLLKIFLIICIFDSLVLSCICL